MRGRYVAPGTDRHVRVQEVPTAAHGWERMRIRGVGKLPGLADPVRQQVPSAVCDQVVERAGEVAGAGDVGAGKPDLEESFVVFRAEVFPAAHDPRDRRGRRGESRSVCVWPGSCRGSPAREGPVGVHESVDVGVTLVRSMIRTRGGSAGGNSVIATVATRGTGSPRRRFPCTLTRDGTGSWQRRRVWSPFRRVGHWAGTIKPRAIPADVRRTRRVCTAWFGSAPSGSTGHGVAAGAVRTALAA
jgi:hypothetical protein